MKIQDSMAISSNNLNAGKPDKILRWHAQTCLGVVPVDIVGIGLCVSILCLLIHRFH
jgi:hypothetical protein